MKTYRSDPWIDVDRKRPLTFDLVQLKDDRGKMIPGWWTGHNWDGYDRVGERVITGWRKFKRFGNNTDDYVET